jgi:serine/threonine-protein kinase
MEYVEGETLAELVARRGPLPAPEVASLGVQVCAALAAAHAAGLVHRDVKPQNLLLRSDGVLKLGDFGIAVGHDGTRLTVQGTVLGTAGYLAPEQARGEEVTAAADIYAVGAVLYELLTGEPPRSISTLAELGAEGGFDPPDVAARAPAAPRELAATVAACLSISPDDRPSSAAELARRLVPAPEAQTLPLLRSPSQRATEILAAPVRRERRPRKAPRLAVIGALVAAAVAGLVLALILSSGGNSSRSRSTPHAVAPPATGANAAEQARALAAWLRSHSH